MPRFVFVKKQVVQAPQYGVEPISLTVSRPQVRSGSVLNNGGGTYGFQLNWVAVANAVKYKVYRATSINGPWDLVATVNAPTVTYTDSPFSFGALRLYRVAAVREQGSSSTGSHGKAPPTTYAQSLLYTHEGTMSNYILFQGIGGFSPQIEAYTTLTTATAQSYGDFIAGGGPASAGFPKPTFVVTINWVAMEGADSIRIYRDGTPIGFASSGLSTSYIDDSTALAWGTEYSYQVAGIVGGVEYEKSDPLVVWTKPAAPTNVTATAPDDQQQPVSLAWTAPTGATGYKIYRDGAYLTDSATNSYSDATTVWGTGYEYQISATNLGGEGLTSVAVYVTTDPAAPAGLTATPTEGAPQLLPVVLAWSAPATGVTVSYNIYRGGAFLANASASPYSDATAVYGATYTYTVKGVNQVGEEGPSSGSSSVTLFSVAAQFGTDLVQHFDASSLSLADGAAVSSWQNLANTAESATQSTPANRPTFVANASNGKPALRFTSASSQWLDFSAHLSRFNNVAYPNGFLVALVVKAISSVDHTNYWNIGVVSDVSGIIYAMHDLNDPDDIDISYSVFICQFTDTSRTFWSSLQAGRYRDPGAWRYGTLYGCPCTGPHIRLHWRNIGVWGGYLNAFVAEIIIVGRSGSAGDISSLMTHLKAKYGL
eukprot:tig00021587_g22696.t1